MGFYDAMKEVLNLAQKADNIELYRQLLDLSGQALDLQEEVAHLRAENAELKNRRDIAGRIVRHKETYISLQDDTLGLCYCAHCWDNDNRLMQLICDEEDGSFKCPHCKMAGIYDIRKHKLSTIDPENFQNQIRSYIDYT